MRDWMGRDLHYLRVSLTERCNLKCIYCREENAHCKAKKELSLEEFTRLMQVFVALGVTKVRLTGGEPLVRRDLEQIVRMTAGFPQIRDISMTTNAQGLADRLSALHAAGLRRINISLDSLDPARYRRMTRGGDLSEVYKGMEAAARENMPVKLNVVLVRGENDQEIDRFIALARAYPIDVRFIELMPFSALGTRDDRRVPGQEILERHPELHPVAPHDVSQPSQDYQADGFAGRVGLINPISHKFCADCNRIRLTSDGKLRMCLGDDHETDLRPWMNDRRLAQVIRDAVYHKPEGALLCAQLSCGADDEPDWRIIQWQQSRQSILARGEGRSRRRFPMPSCASITGLSGMHMRATGIAKSVCSRRRVLIR